MSVLADSTAPSWISPLAFGSLRGKGATREAEGDDPKGVG
jgi:hypothetical protein